MPSKKQVQKVAASETVESDPPKDQTVDVKEQDDVTKTQEPDDVTNTQESDSDSESESESESDAESEDDFENELEEQEEDDDDELAAALNDSKEKKAKEIRRLLSLETRFFEIRHISKEYDSHKFKGNKMSILMLQDIHRKEEPFMVYAPSTLERRRVLGDILKNGAYIKPEGLKKSDKTNRTYTDYTYKSLSKRRAPAFDLKEDKAFAGKISKAFKSVKREAKEQEKEIDEYEKLIAAYENEQKERKKTKTSKKSAK